MKCKFLIILLYSWLCNENQTQKSGNYYYYYYFSLLAIETYGNWCNNSNFVASVSIFGEIPHPANQKKNPRQTGTKAFFGEKWHIVATLGGIIFWIRHIQTIGSSTLSTYNTILKLFSFPL